MILFLYNKLLRKCSENWPTDVAILSDSKVDETEKSRKTETKRNR